MEYGSQDTVPVQSQRMEKRRQSLHHDENGYGKEAEEHGDHELSGGAWERIL